MDPQAKSFYDDTTVLTHKSMDSKNLQQIYQITVDHKHGNNTDNNKTKK